VCTDNGDVARLLLTLLYWLCAVRLSVLGAITSTQQKLKLYTRIPDNGLVLYCGTILTDDGKEKRVNIDFEPFKPINTSLYLCDNKFHTEVRAINVVVLIRSDF
jgi:peptide subunit release factor 1 (eRF1)